ncbi:hypothetical protein Aperf_G00000000545 [Anoplocephala perfoliata]
MQKQVDATTSDFDGVVDQSKCRVLGQQIDEEDMRLQCEEEILENVSVLHALEAAFDLAIKKASSEIKSLPLAMTLDGKPDFGDYQCNNYLSLAKSFQEVAINDLFVISVPDFMSRKFVEKEIAKLARLVFHVAPSSQPLTCVVDMSSPNIAKEIHLMVTVVLKVDNCR